MKRRIVWEWGCMIGVPLLYFIVGLITGLWNNAKVTGIPIF